MGRSHPALWVPLCSPSVPTEMISECFREDRSFLSPCDSSLIFWLVLSPPMVWELGSRNQKQSSHHGLTMGSCQPEAHASFLPGKGSVLIFPVEFCGFVRQAEADVTKLAALSWPQAPSVSPGPDLSQTPRLISSCLPFISAMLSGAC